MQPEPSPAAPTADRSLRLLVPLGLALVVWVIPFVPVDCRRTQSAAPVWIEPGTATSLRNEIQASPRAVVYVGCPFSIHAARGEQFFRKAVAELSANRATRGARFFLIWDETEDDAQAWAVTFKDERLDMFGHLGCGWVLWLEYGRLRAVDEYAGIYSRTSGREIVERTRSVWP